MGLIFGSRRAWIDIDSADMILRDDGYARIELPDAQPGDLVFYNHPEYGRTHVGCLWVRSVTGPSPFRVLSQFGGDGEYHHDLNDVPEIYGVANEFWTDRR
jgi:hypothetical protein